MISPRLQFYRNVISSWIPDHDASVLIVGAGANDRDVFLDLGFKNVVISNLDTRMKGDEFSPFQWSFEDVENLTYPDRQFDYVVVHAALHHCYSPHRALLEMYRVAKKAVVVLEARDSALMRLSQRLHFTREFEVGAVFNNGGQFGGVANTDVPNYVYRWNEREIEKTIASAVPYANHTYSYQYGHDLSASVNRNKQMKRQFRAALVKYSVLLYEVFARFFPSQQNLFAFKIDKPRLPQDLFPWVTMQGDKIVFNTEWAKKEYKVK